ncbi:Cell number regulator 8, partial [Cucurbita argyrosperma subsp. argyrosperma]
MANGENLEESSPLLGKVVEKADEKDTHRISTGDRADAVPPPPPVRKFAEEENGGDGCDYGWTADGLPIHGSVMGEPVGRAQWETGLCACLGRHDEFCSSDLEGNCEALHRSCGCCGLCVEDEVQREHCESVCDFATHVFCHTCALCQEGRELRRRMPHPGFNARPVLVMIPPAEQSMGRGV